MGIWGYIRLIIAGAIGVAALILTLELPAEVQAQLEEVGLPLEIVLLISAAQSVVFVAIAVVLGGLCSGRTGLVSWIGGANTDGRSFDWLSTLVFAGIAAGIGVVTVMSQSYINQNVPELVDYIQNQAEELEALNLGAGARLLYGGLTEEVLLRWGMMGVLTWLFLWIMPRGFALALAIILSSLLFAAGHLPALYQMAGPPPMAMLAFVLIANSVYGLWFGFVFQKNSLEAAMMAHGAAHIGMMAGVKLLQMSAGVPG